MCRLLDFNHIVVVKLLESLMFKIMFDGEKNPLEIKNRYGHVTFLDDGRD